MSLTLNNCRSWANTMTPSEPHQAGNIVEPTGVMAAARPPRRGSSSVFPSATKPICLPSGDQKGNRAPSAPGSSRASNSSSERIRRRNLPSSVAEMARLRPSARAPAWRSRKRRRNRHAEADESRRCRRRGFETQQAEDAQRETGSRDRPGRPARACGCRRRRHAGIEQQPPVADAGETLRSIFCKAGAQQTTYARGRFLDVWFLAEDCGKRGVDGVAGKRTLAGHEFKHHDAERPDICALVDRLSFRLLRSHVGGRADRGSFCRHSHGDRRGVRRRVADNLRETKIEHFHAAAGSDLDVGGFEIAVDDALFVRGFEGCGDLSGDAQRLIERQRAFGEAPSTSSMTM